MPKPHHLLALAFCLSAVVHVHAQRPAGRARTPRAASRAPAAERPAASAASVASPAPASAPVETRPPVGPAAPTTRGPRFVVVPLRIGDLDPSPAASTLRDVLAANGVAVWRAEEASERFEAVHSADPIELAPNDVAVWVDRSRRAARQLARGDYVSARAALLEAQGVSERAAEALNREAARARQVLDTCLFVVRAAIETGDAAAAEEQTRRCRRLVPRVQPNRDLHTPEVRAMLERVAAEAPAARAGSVRVESDPPGCSVRFNGVYFGATPLETSELEVGEYRVQVECVGGVPGRVRRISVGPAPVHVVVHARLDDVFRSRPTVGLAYASESDAATRADDARMIERAIGAPVLLVRRGADGIVVVERLGRDGIAMLARLPTEELGAQGPALAEIVARRSSRGLSRSRGARASDDPTLDPLGTDLPPRSNARGSYAIGGSLVALAVWPLAAGAYTLRHPARCVSDVDPCPVYRPGTRALGFGYDARVNLGVGAAVAALGSVFLATRPIRLHPIVDATQTGLVIDGRF